MKGKDKDGNAFQGYSKGYKKSLDFKIAGKSSLVNLTLSKEMLSELDLISTDSESLLIGYDKNDSDLNGKVEGNRLGTYGNKKPVTKPRDFLGIADEDLKKILKKYPVKSDKVKELSKNFKISQLAADEIINEVDIGFEE